MHELLRAFNVAKVQKHKSGSSAQGGLSYGGGTSPGASRAGSWELQEVADAQGRLFLLDNDTKASSGQGAFTAHAAVT